MEEMDALTDHAINEAGQFRELALQEIKEAEDAWQRLLALFNTIILAGVILTIFLILGGLFFFRRVIIFPILSLRDAASEVGRGNLEKKVNIKPGDEIGDLAISFNKMVESLRKLMQKEKEIYQHRAEALFSYEQNIRDNEAEIKSLKLEINNLLQELDRPTKY